MELYGNKMWFTATDNSKKCSLYVRSGQFNDFINLLEKFGLNYYAYTHQNTAGKTLCKVSFNRNDLKAVEELTGQSLSEKTEPIPEKPLPNKNIIGNTPYSLIGDKKWIKKSDRRDIEYSSETAERDILLKAAELLDKQGIKFSGRIYNEHTTLTFNQHDAAAVKSAYNTIFEKRKQIKREIQARKKLSVIENGVQSIDATDTTVEITRSDLSYSELTAITPLLNIYGDFVYIAAAKKDGISFSVEQSQVDKFNRAVDMAITEYRLQELKIRFLCEGFTEQQLENMDFENLGRFFIAFKIDPDEIFVTLNSNYTSEQNLNISELLVLIHKNNIQPFDDDPQGYYSKIAALQEEYNLEVDIKSYLFKHEYSTEQENAIRKIVQKEKCIPNGVLETIDESFTPNDIEHLYELYLVAVKSKGNDRDNVIITIKDFIDNHFKQFYTNELPKQELADKSNRRNSLKDELQVEAAAKANDKQEKKTYYFGLANLRKNAQKCKEQYKSKDKKKGKNKDIGSNGDGSI